MCSTRPRAQAAGPHPLCAAARVGCEPPLLAVSTRITTALVLPGRAARPVAALRPRGWGSGGDARGRAAQAHGVQAYLAGHDHNLEHIHVPGASVHYIISGGGSKSDRGFIGAAHSAFQWPASGFVAARLGRDELALEFLCYTGGGDDLRPCYVVRVPRAR